MTALFPKMALPSQEEADMAIFFLMGPDFGGGGWQRQMYGRLCYQAQQHALSHWVAAIPCRYEETDPMAVHLHSRAQKNAYKYQLEWERDYIKRAASTARQGCVLSWLPEESSTEPRMDGEPYARDTRGEIGEIRGWMLHDRSIRFVLGGEEGFRGLDVIVRNFSYVLGGPFPLHSTLDDVARYAVRLAKYQHK